MFIGTPSTVSRRVFVNITNWENQSTRFGTIQVSSDGRTLIDAAISNDIMHTAVESLKRE